MCGRWATPFTKDNIEERYKISLGNVSFEPSYNIAPGSKVVTIVKNKELTATKMQWGLVPFWAKEKSRLLINTRAETINQKPTFKTAFKSRRCLIPSGGFYEWKKENNQKTPYYIHSKTEPIISFAGIYSESLDNTGKKQLTFSIITKAANQLISSIHNRMPVVLDKDKEDTWLNQASSANTLLDLLTSYPANDDLQIYQVSSAVNKVTNNYKELLSPVSS
jgi:putative SOS response-associated peptidase YedK